MTTAKNHAGNPLGDLRAEHDHRMLDVAFYETPDYRSLIETNDKTVVVGRRGTGKSALAYCLSKYWHNAPKTRVVELSLEEDQVIGLGPIIQKLGPYRLINAGCKLAWRYCMVMEIALQLSSHFKFQKANRAEDFTTPLKAWQSFGKTTSARLRRLLQSIVIEGQQAEHMIAELADKLNIAVLESALDSVLESMDLRTILLIDRMDEGYEPTDVGVGFINGVVNGTVAFNAKHTQVRAILFLRDDMFRTVAKRDPDYSRNIEGQVLRLHWEELTCPRFPPQFKRESLRLACAAEGEA